MGLFFCLILNIMGLEALQEKYNTQPVLSFHNKSPPFLMIFHKWVPNTDTTQASNFSCYKKIKLA